MAKVKKIQYKISSKFWDGERLYQAGDLVWALPGKVPTGSVKVADLEKQAELSAKEQQEKDIRETEARIKQLTAQLAELKK